MVLYVNNRYWSDCNDALTDLSLNLAHMSESMFSQAEAQCLGSIQGLADKAVFTLL